MRICIITSIATLCVSNICDPLLSRNVAYPWNVLRARHHLAHSDYASKRSPIDSTALRITRTCLTIVQDLWHCSLFSDRGIIPQYAPRYACKKTNFWENKQPHHYLPYRPVRITHHACGRTCSIYVIVDLAFGINVLLAFSIHVCVRHLHVINGRTRGLGRVRFAYCRVWSWYLLGL